MEFLSDRQGLTLVEYIVAGAISLIVLATSVWGISRSAQTQGNAVTTAVNGLPAMPNWP